MRHIHVLAVLMLWVGVLASAPAYSQGASASLRGLTGFELVVEEMIPEATLDGLSRTDLHSAVEARLREAGFNLRPDGAGDAYLYVNVNMTSGSGIYIYCADLQLRQASRLVRDPDRAVPDAITWHTGVVGAVPAADLQVGITSVVLDELDAFIREYDEENPGTITVPPPRQPAVP